MYTIECVPSARFNANSVAITPNEARTAGLGHISDSAQTVSTAISRPAMFGLTPYVFTRRLLRLDHSQPMPPPSPCPLASPTDMTHQRTVGVKKIAGIASTMTAAPYQESAKRRLRAARIARGPCADEVVCT